MGSRDVLRGRGLELLAGKDGVMGKGTLDGNDVAGVTTVWCCVMTFYRAAVFSYEATLDGQVLLDDKDEGSNANNNSNNNE